MSDADLPKPWLATTPKARATTIEYEQVSIYEYLKKHAAERPGDLFLISPGGSELTYGEIYGSVRKMAGFLSKNGIVKGDRVALLLPNTPHYVIGHYATMALGATVVQANPLYTVHELSTQIKDSGAKAIISLTMFATYTLWVSAAPVWDHLPACSKIQDTLSPGLMKMFTRL